ncbi:DNA topoisomerase 3 [Acidiferrobacter thiooxydans]|uniref:DNA topoisomerase 3 n=1 Tax=Acidiferrobacter thiooxydans TaxID=163359 RepID=UPI000825DEF2|nr:DNA topoisomerase 3 [Acidiferrobacter thiooxydans]UEO00475.1 DNA topoisomerase 3 [Acidiferrobacter thiooxydans]
MILYIAEKPSLGKAIAAQLPGPRKPTRTHIECGGSVTVTWAFGHLFEQAEPDAYLSDSVPKNGKGKKKWRLEDLPIIPETWQKVPKAEAREQLTAIRGLLKNASEVVNAGDPDREGQLLIDEILEAMRWKGPTKRIWLAALDPASVQKALADLKDNTAYRPLRDAAETRARADWLVGMNLTRAYTLKSNGQGVVSVGRVQTPTLALVVRRDLEIDGFTPITFYVPVITFRHNNGEYKATWKAPANADGLDGPSSPQCAEGRLTNLPAAQAIISVADHQAGTVKTFDTEDANEAPPLPFTLSRLQATASAKHGLSAKATLDAAQALYETHKLATYPRTDCPYLPESQMSDARLVLAAIARVNPDMGGLVKGADMSLKSQAWNDAKIGAHHGIIPTSHDQVTVDALSESERQVYDLIVRAYICQFYPPHRYTKTVTVTECGGHDWEAKGRTQLAAGWRAVLAGPEKREDAEAQVLPLMKVGDTVDWQDGLVDHRQTKAPARFTDGTLIAAMSSVHKLVQDPKIKARLKETSGLGTEATRAAIIEVLIKRGFIERKGKQVLSTESGRILVAALPPALTDPGVTGLWEDFLSEIAAGNRTLDEFETQQRAFVVKRVEAAKAGASLAMGRAAHNVPVTAVKPKATTKKRRSK